MNILVVGASQGTGAECVRAALEKGHAVTAFARSPQKLVLEHPKLKRVAGDFLRAEDLAAATPGHDAVVVTASASSLKAFRENPTFFSAGTAHVITAMKAAGVRRLSVLSAHGAGESRALAGFVQRTLLIGWILKTPFEDHDRQEALVRASGLEWVIARPGRLTNGPARRKYVKKATLEPVPSAISRADVADFLIEACESDAWVGKAVQIGG